MSSSKRKPDISLWGFLHRCLEAPFRPAAFALRRILRGASFGPLRQLAERCTPRALQRGLLSLVLLVLCLQVFFHAVPLLQAAAPTAYAQETPELVNTVSFSEDTTMQSLEVQWLRGPITVRPYNGKVITVNEYAEDGLKADEKGRVYLSGKNLVVEWVDSALPIVDSGVGGGMYKRLEVLIPREQAGALEYIRILSGESDISVTGLKHEISARVETTVGNITLEDISAPLTVLKSESGAISCLELDTDELRLRTHSGAVALTKCDIKTTDLRSVEGPVFVQGKLLWGTVQTYSAPVKLELTAIPSAIEVHSSLGDISVTQPKNTADVRVKVFSEYGKTEEFFA